MKKIIISLMLGCVSVSSYALATIKEGVDYTTINKPAVNALVIKDAKKINVTEFYSYACIHCQLVEPNVEAWLAKSKNTVDFTRIQVVWETNFVGFAKINATVQALNLSPAFNQKVFDTVMAQRQDLQDPKQLQVFLNANKNLVDPVKFMNMYNSFSISSKPQEYAAYTKAYNITGTPTFIVDGKYMTKPAQPARLMEVVQALVEKSKR